MPESSAGAAKGALVPSAPLKTQLVWFGRGAGGRRGAHRGAGGDGARAVREQRGFNN